MSSGVIMGAGAWIVTIAALCVAAGEIGLSIYFIVATRNVDRERAWFDMQREAVHRQRETIAGRPLADAAPIAGAAPDQWE